MTARVAAGTSARPVLREDHEAFRTQVRRFVDREIAPHHTRWEDEGRVPASLWRAAGAAGLLCTTLPEPWGAGGDFGHAAVIIEELARVNATGVGFSLHSEVVAPYLHAYGTPAQHGRWLPAMAAGTCIGAIAMTEPDAGSDLKAIRTTARRDGDAYVLSGQKTYISNGLNAGLVIVVAKTDPAAGARGLSLLVVENGIAGFRRGPALRKIGLRAQDTAELFFDEVRVPIAHRLGEEGQGFGYLMHQLAQERLVIAVRAAASVEAFLARTIAWTRERKAFGQRVLDYQNTRFRLAEAKAQAVMLRAFVDDCLARHLRGELDAERAAMAKLVGSEMQNRLLDECLQLHGGQGFMADGGIGSAWVDARVARIYGGSNEIMREIIARGL
ncbi:acyl-CoA dehydrogenase family protein [Ramlibacter sp.]|uniref:acyl-CoA dehydrogenase family protein n=1 Tax=Ramlibacter sp. TaxID=1917967 RepID=UPI0035B4977D